MSADLPGTVDVGATVEATVEDVRPEIEIGLEEVREVIDLVSTITVNVTTANFDSVDNIIVSNKILSPAQLFISSISDSIKDKPKTAAEAAALYAYILQKDIYPLMLELKNLFVSELSTLEKDAASSFLKEVGDIKQVTMTKMKSCLPFL
jgi:hypothetical protein